MEGKELKIIPPTGFVVDEENSTFECIKFKPKKLTYDDVAKDLFLNQTAYYPNIYTGGSEYFVCCGDNYMNLNNCCSKVQVKKLMALNKLINVAKYLNNGWEPDWNNINESKYFIYICDNKVEIGIVYTTNYGLPYFKISELAQQAIEILGEKTIKLALSSI